MRSKYGAKVNTIHLVHLRIFRNLIEKSTEETPTTIIQSSMPQSTEKNLILSHQMYLRKSKLTLGSCSRSRLICSIPSPGLLSNTINQQTINTSPPAIADGKTHTSQLLCSCYRGQMVQLVLAVPLDRV